MCTTTLLAILVPLVLGGKTKTDQTTGETTFEVENKGFGYAMVALRYLCMLGFYGGAVGVIYSIFVFEAPGGPDATLPVSPAVHCVVNLTCQFFFVSLMVTIMHTVNEITAGKVPLEEYR